MNKKYAYCVGNNYPNTNAELKGCVNDANDWGEFLARRGYEVIVQTEVIKKHFVEQLTKSVSKLGFADKLIVTYSGHGTWLPDQNGDELDGRDEALVMTDYEYGGLVIDDELDHIFKKAAWGSNRLLFLDACHSGTGNRFLAPKPTADIPDWLFAKPRFLSPAEFTQLNEIRAMDAEEKVPAQHKVSSSLISGSDDLEYSYDAWFQVPEGWRANGAMTRAALDTYQEGMTLKAWYNAIHQILPGDYPQTPQLSALSGYRLYTKAL